MTLESFDRSAAREIAERYLDDYHRMLTEVRDPLTVSASREHDVWWVRFE